MRKYVTTIILVAIFSGLLIFFWLYESKKEDKKEEESLTTKSFVAWEVNRDDIVSFKIKNDDKEIEVKKEADGSWRIIKPIEAKAKIDQINSILDEYKKIEGKGEEIRTDNLAEYGLDKPKSSLILKLSNGSEKEIIFGDASIDETNIYVKTSGKDTVFLVDKLLSDKIKISENDLKE